MKTVTLLFAFALLFGACSGKKNQPVPTVVHGGDTLHTDYFDIVVHSGSLEQTIITGNPYTDKPDQDGSSYLIFNATFTNVDTESRVPFPGSLFVKYQGKEYKFDKPETIMAKGWGVGFEPINPLETRECKLVYALSDQITGELLWEPGRANSGQRIRVGDISKQ